MSSGGTPWGQIGSSIGSVLNMGVQQRQNDKAADALNESNDQYLAFLKSRFDEDSKNAAPWLQRGTQALDLYSKALGMGEDGANPANAGSPQRFQAFFDSPGRQFQIDQGTQAVERSAAAQGMLGSGSTLKDLTKFSQGNANQNYGQFMAALMGLSGQGQQAAGQQNALSSNFQQNYGGAIQNRGDIRASEYLGVGGAWQNMHNDLMGIWGGGATGGGGGGSKGGGMSFAGIDMSALMGGSGSGGGMNASSMGSGWGV